MHTVTSLASVVVDAGCSSRDLTLVLESSYSLGGSDWTRLTSFVGRLVDELRRRRVVSRSAVVTYSHSARVDLPLADRDSSQLTSLPFAAGHGRNIADALRLTRTSVSARIHRSATATLFPF